MCALLYIPQVVVNCIMALNEIMAAEGGIAVNQAIIHHLLNRIKDFSEWGQCIVLDVVAKYQPEEVVRIEYSVGYLRAVMMRYPN